MKRKSSMLSSNSVNHLRGISSGKKRQALDDLPEIKSSKFGEDDSLKTKNTF
jgi:hypothetical protein